MSPVAAAGRHASVLLLLGFLTVPFLPVDAEAMRPALPLLVSLATALAVSPMRARAPGSA
ncbi:hypothetical protein [Mangrovicoccus ximenensis]|uniref:hypothetical protein n=1 Tax=Mangrovicoccus ximenensis TaxID=1911570 RepID=UPI000D35AFE8|nr:hypothetical protein [Mangrovicoccus ximenensis]